MAVLVALRGLEEPGDGAGGRSISPDRSPVEIQFGLVVPGAGLHCDLGKKIQEFSPQSLFLVPQA